LPEVLESDHIDVIPCHFMLVGNFIMPLTSTQNRRRRRRSSLYFSSTKALRRSRMTKFRKGVSKTRQCTPGDTRKSLHFGGGSSGGEEHNTALQFDDIVEELEGTLSAHVKDGEENVSTVSLFVFIYFNSNYLASCSFMCSCKERSRDILWRILILSRASEWYTSFKNFKIVIMFIEIKPTVYSIVSLPW